MFEETRRTFLCSDLFTHPGNVEAQTASDVVGRFKQGLINDLQGVFANAYPYSSQTDDTLRRLAALEPRTLALMHGSTFVGDGKRAIEDLAIAMREVLGSGSPQVATTANVQ